MNPWNQDQDPYAQGIEYEDFIEGVDDEQDELGIDYTARRGGAHALEDAPQQPTRQPTRQPPTIEHGRGSKARVRPMSPTMASRNADVASILVTKYDGTQTLFVRR